MDATSDRDLPEQIQQVARRWQQDIETLAADLGIRHADAHRLVDQVQRQNPGTDLQASPSGPNPPVALQLTLPGHMVAALDDLALRFGTDRDQAAQRILRAHFDGRARVMLTPRQLMAVQAEAKARGHEWREAELLERGLPLYWSEAWLRGQLARGMTLPELHILYGYKTRTLAQYALHYGIEQRVEAGIKTYQRARGLIESGSSRAEVAAALGFSENTVARAARGLASEKGLYIEAKIGRAGPWPAKTADIADRVFEGDRSLARPWIYRMVNSGRLVKRSRDTYVLPEMSEPVAED